MRWAFYAFVCLILYLTVCAVVAPFIGKILKRRRLEMEVETEEVFGAPEGGIIWLPNGRTVH